MSSPMKRRIRNVTRFLPGGSLAVAGTLVALGGGGLLAAFGTDGRLASGPHLLSTPAGAIVSSITNIKNTSGLATIAGQPTLRISAAPVQGTTAAFIGIGRAVDVDRYLAGVATQEVTDLTIEPYSITGTPHAGQADAGPPASQRFWVAQASSTRAAEINWKIRDGQYRVVIMNANGHGGFATTSAIALTIPNIARYALAGLLIGLLMAGGGTALLIRASGQSRNRSSNARSTTSPAAATTA